MADITDIEMGDVIEDPRQLTDRQMNSLVSLWRLSHYKQAPWSTWSILYSNRRSPKKKRSPMICFETEMYEKLLQQQEDEQKARQLHQHQMWQHVQDRLAEQNKILENEKEQQQQQAAPVVNGKKGKKGNAAAAAAATSGATAESADTPLSPVLSTASSRTVTSASASPEMTPTKRNIRWGLQNNMVKRFDKTSPITLVTVPAVDKRPTKSALKVRTPHTIQKSTPSATSNTKSINTQGTAKAALSERKHAMDFF